MKNTASITANSVLDQTCNLLERIFPAPRNFSINLWGLAELPADGNPEFTTQDVIDFDAYFPYQAIYSTYHDAISLILRDF